jgi:predicted transcriptional regulator
MQRSQPDPFFKQLEADLREGVEAADRGELIPAEDVWADLYARVDEIEKNRVPYRS